MAKTERKDREEPVNDKTLRQHVEVDYCHHCYGLSESCPYCLGTGEIERFVKKRE